MTVEVVPDPRRQNTKTFNPHVDSFVPRPNSGIKVLKTTSVVPRQCLMVTVAVIGNDNLVGQQEVLQPAAKDTIVRVRTGREQTI